ncbi:MAG: hypothetical protein M3N02_03630 [Pseudomonadota bacterium]|nr:hypothetical protein [Pseudomonadota bacterium]
MIVLCLAQFARGLKTDLLTAVLSILAITLTQRVLNSQKEGEVDDRRRDEAMYAKRDERLLAMTGVRDGGSGSKSRRRGHRRIEGNCF